MPGLNTSPVAKLLVPLLVVGVILGGWTWINRYRESHVALPDDESRHNGCMLWFVGSSSIHRWTSLAQDMAPWETHNRGINSATLPDILSRFANIEAKEGRPRAMILYVGENDIANGAPVRTVIHQLAALLDMRARLLGDVPVLLLSMKPSPGRAASLPDQRLYNLAAQRLTPHAANVHYVDITTPLLAGGRLGDNYQADGVHMNPRGYRIWADVVHRRLDQILPTSVVRQCAPDDEKA